MTVKLSITIEPVSNDTNISKHNKANKQMNEVLAEIHKILNNVDTEGLYFSFKIEHK